MFSIIIPLYNKEISVKQTLLQVLNQTYSQYEVIIVNDGSTDRSLESVKNFTDKRIRIISIPHSGVSYARNVGILNARYDIIAFLDADDLWKNEYLEKMKILIETCTDTAVYYSGIIRNTETINQDKIENTTYTYIDNYYSKYNKNRICTSCMMVKKDVLFSIGLYNIQFLNGQDLDLSRRLLAKYTPAFCSDILVTIRLDAENRNSQRLPPIPNKMDYHLNITKIQDKEERYYWIRHVYGNISIYY